MPIRPENKALYPPDWKERRARILRRSEHCCEGSPRYPDCRAANYAPHPVTGSKVVLTIGHVHHDPTDNRPCVLRAWCQRCHNAHDAQHRAATRRRGE